MTRMLMTIECHDKAIGIRDEMIRAQRASLEKAQEAIRAQQELIAIFRAKAENDVAIRSAEMAQVWMAGVAFGMSLRP